jgi:hypothetical protein
MLMPEATYNLSTPAVRDGVLSNHARFSFLTSAMWSFLDSTLELPDGRVNLLGAGRRC